MLFREPAECMGKGEIGWKGRFPDGRRRQVQACCVRREWRFRVREKRFDEWRRLEHPSLDDWRRLLDAVERREQRRLLPLGESDRIRRKMREIFGPESGA